METQLLIARNLGYIEEEAFREILEVSGSVSRMLHRLVQSVTDEPGPPDTRNQKPETRNQKLETDHMVFVLDNYDSFTYNLVQYFGELGAEVVVRRNDQITTSDVEALAPDRIVVSPGPCTPQDAGISIELIRAFAGKVPLLGVCLGHQAIGAAFGGRVVRAAHLMHGKTSAIEHDGQGVFRALPSPFTATRYHSLVVAEDGLPDELEVSARTQERDGSHVIMGLRHRHYPVEGVQFHPESVLTTEGKKLISNFLQM
jgi:anthranilate synthase/aminodeoxychorismate synthase-like glutamine amidotransferase